MEITLAFLASLLTAGVLTACSDGSTPLGKPTGGPGARPDVVFIVIDTLRADAVLDPKTTPNIDRLRRDGIDLPHAFAAAPMTLPSHMSLFSSRPPFESKVLHNEQGVPLELPLLAEWLSSLGYDTRGVISLGTMRSPGLDQTKGPGRGFANYRFDPWGLAKASQTTGMLVESLRERDEGKPLFLFAHFADPHEPYDAHGTVEHHVALRVNGAPVAQLLTSETEPWAGEVELGSGLSTFEFTREEKAQSSFRVRIFQCSEDGEPLDLQWEEGDFMRGVKRAVLTVDRGERPPESCLVRVWANDMPGYQRIKPRYALEVEYVDTWMGKLLAELERLGLYDHSLIVFTSDHGEALGEGGAFGHVEFLTDVLLHVPLIIKLPAADSRRPQLALAAERMVTHLDLVPTVLDLTGLPPLPGQRGQSLLVPHDSVHIAQTSRPTAARNQVALRDAHYSMVFFPDEDRFELHDLERDPLEEHDVFAEAARERPAWPERLREIGKQSTRSLDATSSAAEKAERDEMLRALGYAGDE